MKTSYREAALLKIVFIHEFSSLLSRKMEKDSFMLFFVNSKDLLGKESLLFKRIETFFSLFVC